MYTRCSHCKAVFRVTMKELTAAQGKLRCGECAAVFNAMDSLSTKLPEQDDSVVGTTFDSLNQKPKEPFKTQEHIQQTPTDHHSIQNHSTTHSARPILSSALVSLLGVILVAQIWLTRDIWFSPARQPEKIQMFSRKVFTHPSQPDALVITGAIENIAEQPQPFPYLEARLLDTNNKVIALRRFRPHEYLERYEKDQLLSSKQQAAIKLKIQDPPGNQAKQFKFSFL